MRITIVYDNEALRNRNDLTPDWGFSCFIETGIDTECNMEDGENKNNKNMEAGKYKNNNKEEGKNKNNKNMKEGKNNKNMKEGKNNKNMKEGRNNKNMEEGKNKILFDTGASGELLLKNMKNLGINPKDIDTVFISHDHGDHTGGLNKLLDEMDNKKLNTIIYVLPSFSESLKNMIKDKGFLYSEVISFSQIRDDVYSTGPLGALKEQSMILRTNKGLIVIGGCSHPGIENIVDKVHKWFPKDKIYLVMGGFHMSGYPENKIIEVINKFKQIGVKKVMPCHCTGDMAKNLFIRDFKDDCITCGAGLVV